MRLSGTVGILYHIACPLSVGTSTVAHCRLLILIFSCLRKPVDGGKSILLVRVSRVRLQRHILYCTESIILYS